MQNDRRRRVPRRLRGESSVSHSAIRLRIGQARAELAGPEQVTREAMKPMKRERVLLVDDDRGVREVVRRFLSDACEISQAATGAEALAILGREQIAAVVLKHPRASSATATNY